MQRSKIEVYLHLVWATRGRVPLLDAAEAERAVHRCIATEARRLKCEVLAVNGMPDHVHLVVKLPSTVAIARLAQAVKGISSKMANEHCSFGGAFDWQDSYAAFSVSISHLPRVVAYVERQKEHHSSQELWPALEETEELC